MKASLVIEYNDGSNPFYMVLVDRKIINKEIAFQKKANNAAIKHIYISNDGE